MGLFDKVSSVFNPSQWGSSNDPIGGGPLGDLIPGIGDARAQDKANKQNIALDQMNRDWQERMSNSAYQRAMADMGKAGLNPILAYQQGGASVPSTSAPSVGASSKTGLTSAAISAFTGINTARTQQQQAQTAQAQMESNVNLATSQTAKTVAETRDVQAATALKQRELKGKGAKEVIDRRGGELINHVLDKVQDVLSNSAKSSGTNKEKVIKVLGINDSSTKPMIKGPQ